MKQYSKPIIRFKELTGQILYESMGASDMYFEDPYGDVE